jgi:hypothetical protein
VTPGPLLGCKLPVLLTLKEIFVKKTTTFENGVLRD